LGAPLTFPTTPIEAWNKAKFHLMHSNNHAYENSETL
jgi:hypothetical protein